jgi:hypothetical protein
MPIVAASTKREWMEATSKRYANRCLPLLIANQYGWVIHNTHFIRVTWDGRPDVDGISVHYKDHPHGLPCPASSHFGHGVLTFTLNYLFRTPPGFNLWVRGPTNWPKDGIMPLDGIVESDWSVAPFTMNWKLTRAGIAIDFQPGEPICMIVPIRRGEIESFEPELRQISDEPELNEMYTKWANSRAQFLSQLKDPNSLAAGEEWQKDYMHGFGPGIKASQHQVKIVLKPFVQEQRGEASEEALPSS